MGILLGWVVFTTQPNSTLKSRECSVRNCRSALLSPDQGRHAVKHACSSVCAPCRLAKRKKQRFRLIVVVEDFLWEV